MRINLYFVLMVALFIAAIITAYSAGVNSRQAEIETRALTLEYQRCYNWQDIELIIFGEIQE